MAFIVIIVYNYPVLYIRGGQAAGTTNTYFVTADLLEENKNIQSYLQRYIANSVCV